MKINNTTTQSSFDAEAETVMDLKRVIHSHIGVPPNNQKLSFNGHKLRNNQSLAHYHIGGGDQIDLEYSLNGGCLDCGNGVECCCLPCSIM